MATFTYTNPTTPIGGLNFNPGFEEVIDTTFTVGVTTADLYELINNDSGPFQGFKVQLTSNVNGTGNFSYFVIGETGEIKPSGTITGMILRAPDGTVIAEVTAGASGFGNQKLQDFHAKLTDSFADSPAVAIANALGTLLSKSNVINGSQSADHLTAVEASVFTEIHGNGGNDVIHAVGSYDRTLVGGSGNDVIRVQNGDYSVHGANADGTGGAGEIDTVEIVANRSGSTDADFYKFSNIDVLRFVPINPPPAGEDGPSLNVDLILSSIGAENLPKVLRVEGSTLGTPNSTNSIDVYAAYDPAATKGVKIDLSQWTFTNWHPDRGSIGIGTNSARALGDTVIGTKVADDIYTYGGDDTIRGGGGADRLDGGYGNDTFVYGRNEAVAGEYVNGGYGAQAGTADKVLILGNNDFTGVTFHGIEKFVFAGSATATFSQDVLQATGASVETRAASPPSIVGDARANTVAFELQKTANANPSIDLADLGFTSWSDKQDRVKIAGTKAIDIISGSVKGDTIDGGAGGDTLQGNAGADIFIFAAGLGSGVDHIADFRRKEGDRIYLDDAMFSKLKAGKLKKSAFEIGERADDRKDRIIYDKDDGVLRYDDDGTGRHKAKIVAIFDDAATLKAGDLMVI